MDVVVPFLTELPVVPLLFLLGLGAAVENVFPPIPSDTFVVLGGVVAGLGVVAPGWVFAVTWACNVGAAFGVYTLGRRRGARFFQGRMGRRLLAPHQFESLGRLYRKHGGRALFVSRFLPGFRAAVPVFAGTVRQPPLRFLLPVSTASAIWYGVLVWAGTIAGGRLDEVLEWVGEANLVLLGVAGLVLVALITWWRRTRRDRPDG